MNYTVAKDTKLSKLIDIRHLTDSAFVLTFERKDLEFASGQHIALGLPDIVDTREYSIYSGQNEDFFQVLIREVETGYMSKKFKQLKPGEMLRIVRPVGFFTLKPDNIADSKHILIASGTGIAPFHSYVKSYPQLNYHILHGIRFADEAYDRIDYRAGCYTACTSRDDSGDFHGRVTDFLNKNGVDTAAIYYLCGNYEMIDDAYSILEKGGIPSEQIKAEVYF